METTTPEIPVLSALPPPAADESGGEPLFSARGLTKIYPSGEAEIRALDGVDLDLFAGELIVLLGASGSGKSTLLNNLGGLDVPTEGTLTYRGQDLTGASEGELTRFRRDSVGFVFQFYNLIPSLTARENVALITEIARDPMISARVQRATHNVQISKFLAVIEGNTFYRAFYGLSTLQVHDAGK